MAGGGSAAAVHPLHDDMDARDGQQEPPQSSGQDDQDYLPLGQLALALPLDDDRGPRSASLSTWVFVQKGAKPGPIICQGKERYPFLTWEPDSRLLLTPLGPSGTSVATNMKLSPCRWSHLAVEAEGRKVRLLVNGVVQAECEADLLESFSSNPGRVLHFSGSTGVNSSAIFCYGPRLCERVMGRGEHLKSLPIELTLVSTSLAATNPDSDTPRNTKSDEVFAVVGGKASCRRKFALDIQLVDALGRAVDRSMEVYASLVYADTETCLKKTHEDAEAPLLTTFDGVEFPSGEKPTQLVGGRASFKLTISQLSSKCDNRLFRVCFQPYGCGRPHPFLRVLSMPIHSVSRKRPHNGKKGRASTGMANERESSQMSGGRDTKRIALDASDRTAERPRHMAANGRDAAGSSRGGGYERDGLSLSMYPLSSEPGPGSGGNSGGNTRSSSPEHGGAGRLKDRLRHGAQTGATHPPPAGDPINRLTFSQLLSGDMGDLDLGIPLLEDDKTCRSGETGLTACGSLRAGRGGGAGDPRHGSGGSSSGTPTVGWRDMSLVDVASHMANLQTYMSTCNDELASRAAGGPLSGSPERAARVFNHRTKQVEEYNRLQRMLDLRRAEMKRSIESDERRITELEVMVSEMSGEIRRTRDLLHSKRQRFLTEELNVSHILSAGNPASTTGAATTAAIAGAAHSLLRPAPVTDHSGPSRPSSGRGPGDPGSEAPLGGVQPEQSPISTSRPPGGWSMLPPTSTTSSPNETPTAVDRSSLGFHLSFPRLPMPALDCSRYGTGGAGSQWMSSTPALFSAQLAQLINPYSPDGIFSGLLTPCHSGGDEAAVGVGNAATTSGPHGGGPGQGSGNGTSGAPAAGQQGPALGGAFQPYLGCPGTGPDGAFPGSNGSGPGGEDDGGACGHREQGSEGGHASHRTQPAASPGRNDGEGAGDCRETEARGRVMMALGRSAKFE